jgi:spore photoproduct lyase
MFSAIYVENEVRDHPRVVSILSRFRDIPVVACSRYGEIFNLNSQNFRIQKNKPALILARKHKGRVLAAPENYGIGGKKNYYFSHMMNCVYDCRYCFLQGMYRSAHYVLFVNYEDFVDDIRETIDANESDTSYFYSGYDCDSLALDPVSGFVDFMVPFFAKQTSAILELRTKSTQIRGLMNHEPFDHCVVAFSFTPGMISQALEHKVPSVEKRLDSMVKLQQQGWKIGLRFDPLIYDSRYRDLYRELFEQVFARLDVDGIHSVSLGVFRLPHGFYKKMVRLYPDEKLFYSGIERQKNMVAYNKELEQELVDYCESQLLGYIPEENYFPCTFD